MPFYFREVPKSDLTHYKIPSIDERAKTTFEAFDTLQTQMNLILEELQKPSTTESRAERLKAQFDRCIYQCDIMFAIFSRNTSLMTENRLQQITVSRHILVK